MRATLFLLAITLTTVGAEDIKTLTGQEYKDATISRAEPDGLVIIFSAGIVKIPFTELSPELQKKYGFTPQSAQKFRSEIEQAAAQRDAAVAAEKERQRQFNLSGLTTPAPTPAPGSPLRRRNAPGSIPSSSIADPSPAAPAALQSRNPTGSVTLDRVFSDYDRNQLSADQQYKNRTFNLGGTIRAITSEDDGPMIEMEVRCNNACWVHAHFLPDEAGGLTQFRPGNRLTFIGTIAGLRGYTLTITNCYLPR